MGFEITSAKAYAEGYPEPIWWAKACRQIGIEPQIEQTTGNNGDRPIIVVRLPELPPEVFERVQARAELLAERDAQGLPTEEKPGGGFPDSDDEVADPFALRVFVDEGKVCLDMGRAVRAVSIHPVAANYLATLLTSAAFEADPELADRLQNKDMRVQVATVKGVDGVVREAVVRLPSPFAEDGDGESENGGDPEEY
jgi:hypothetical protein